MKLILYRAHGIWHATSEESYSSKALQKFPTCTHAMDVIEYYVKNLHCKLTDFDILNENGIRYNWYDMYLKIKEVFGDKEVATMTDFIQRLEREATPCPVHSS